LPGRNGSYKWPKVEEAYEFLFGKTGYVEAHRGADDAMHEGEIVYELIKRNKFNVTW
jgi:DNA polymerase-3 subunit epsilon